jgi:hypothetical protein
VAAHDFNGFSSELFQVPYAQVLLAELNQVNAGSSGLFDPQQESGTLLALGAGKPLTVGDVAQKHQAETVSCTE